MITRCRAWLDLFRVSNVPTCLSNVLVGWAIAGAPDQIGTLIWIAGVICVIYLAGMVLNDVIDTPWDRTHRPDRPIPRGIIRRSTAGIVGVVLLVGATGVTVLLGPAVFTATAVLAGLVLIYDVAHRAWPVAVLGMALCRAMVYLIAAIAASEAVPSGPLMCSMLALGLWTAGLTLIARRESAGQAMRWPLVLLFLAIPIALWIGGGNLPLMVLTGILLLLQLLWIATKLLQPNGVIPAVLASIAGISLLDAFILGILDVPLYAVIAVCCFLVVTIVHRPLPGT